MSVQDYKINYKSDFVLNINGDAGWAIPFCIKFWTGMPSQAYFVGFDGVKYVNCRVGDTPTQLLVMFDDHHLPIGPLRMQIAYHTTIEEFPGSVFDEVTNARDVIVTIDGTDYQVMLDFTGEDAPDLEFDLPAYANEAERIQNELQRQQNEADRIAAELQREQATAAAVQGAEYVNAQLNGTTLTVTNRNGVSTSVNTKGEQGEQGPVGPEGPQGQKGVSVTGLVKTGETETDTLYNVTFSDGTTQAVTIPKGEKGDTGATGPTGPQGQQGQTGVSITGLVKTGETETDTLYNVTFSNGTTQAVAIPKGEKGDQGPVGPQGPQGPMGDVAVITPEQQAAFTMYSVPGQNTNGPMTQKATTDAIGNIAASGVDYDNSQSGLAAENVQKALDETADIVLGTPTEVVNLVQGHIGQDGTPVSRTTTRVSTGDFINAMDNAITICIKNGYCIRTANKYDSTGTHIGQILNAVDYTSYKFEKGYKYKVTFCNKSNPSANITPSNLDDCVFVYTLPNKSMEELDDAISNNAAEISATNNMMEDISGGGEAVQMLPFVQGFIRTDGGVENLPTRVSTDFIDATESSLILKATGDYRIRNGNRYTAAGVSLGQVIQADLLEEFELQMGYKYRMTFCNKDDLSANITPAMVEPYVSLETPSKRQIVVKVNETANKVDVLAEQKKNEGNYLISDYFNENNYNPNNYSNFSASNLSSGHYNIAAGWTNTLKMSKVVSFQDFAFEFDVNVTNNTEKIVVATEVTEAVAGSIYGSCAYIDMNAARMYLLKPKLYNNSNPPSTPSSSNIAAQTVLTNITSSGHRYIVSFGKKDRNLFVKFRNYYTNEIIELTCTDTNNTSLAGSGYDKIRVGSMSGAISLNSIVGATKTNVDVLFVGDSITDGRNIPLTDSWAYKFGEYLTDNYLIAARAGGQIQQVINLLNAYGQIISPKVIIASVGVNGGNTTDKFLELFNVIKSLNAIPVINTIYNVGSDFSNITEEEWNTMNSYILSLPCKHIRFDIASSANKYSPVFKELDSSYTLTDSVHPDSGGSELLYQRAVLDLKQLEIII